MSPVILSLGAGVAIMLVSLVGVITTIRLIRRQVERGSHLLASFSAGVFLIVVFLLVQELFFEHGGFSTAHYIRASSAIVGGALLMTLLARIPEFHHHHAGDEDHTHSHKSARRIIVSDAAHNVSDGIIIATAFMTDVSLGFAATGAVIIHEIVQEFSEFFVLRQSGYSVRKALIVNAAVSSTILVGIALTFLLGHIASIETILLGFAVGTLSVVVFHDLIPQTVRWSRNNNTVFRHLVAFFLGICSMGFIVLLSPHNHEDPADHEEHEVETERTR